ncbi:ArnT family glycosyltransferase [Paenibacillus chitinolyticus]|uniref:ArnT family glycosyltransferase n=1 Tax=Paenibacillus chitinolyticus TaxID=79263 RepID=UPI00366CB7B2
MFTLKEENLKTKQILYVLMAIVLAVSAFTALYYGDAFLLGTYEKMDNDDVKYMYAAKVLLEEGTLVYKSYPNPTLFIMPGFPVMLAFFMWIFGDYENTAIAVRLFQCVLQAASIYLLFVIARHMFNSRVALIACIIAALYPPNYYTSGVILSEGIFQIIFLLLVCMTLYALKKPSVGKYIAIGAFLALCAYFKPQFILFPLIIGVTWLIRRVPFKKMVLYTATIVLTACLLLSPWWVRNYAHFGKFIPFTDSSGNPMLMGVLPGEPSPGFFKEYPQYSPDVYDDSTEKVGHIILYSLKTKPFETIKWYLFDKTILAFEQTFYWLDFWGMSYNFVLALHIILCVLGVAGFIAALIKRRGDILVAALTVAYVIAVHIPFVQFSRYMYPIIFIFTIFAAYLIAVPFGSLSFRRSSSVTRHFP